MVRQAASAGGNVGGKAHRASETTPSFTTRSSVNWTRVLCGHFSKTDKVENAHVLGAISLAENAYAGAHRFSGRVTQPRYTAQHGMQPRGQELGSLRSRFVLVTI